MTGIEHARAAIEELQAAVKGLREESDAFYDAGDNRQGNLAYDAAATLERHLPTLESTVKVGEARR